MGLMGEPMAKNLLQKGYPLIAWNRTPSKLDSILSYGATAASTPRELARQSDAIIIMVTDSPDVQEIVLGDEGIIHGARPGTAVIDMSTISPLVTQELSQQLGARSIRMLDAPVSGGVIGAINGTLSIMVGGPNDLFQELTHVLEAMGQRITYCGTTGSGQVAKLVNQIIVVGTLAAVSEGLVFAARAGADMDSVFQAVSGGAANSWQLENLGRRILKGDFEPGFRIRLQQKDLRLVLETARKIHAPLFSTPIAQQLYSILELDGLEEAGTQSYIKVLEKLAGVQARSSTME